MKKNIFLLATASLLVAASCGKDDNGGASGGERHCYTCTKTTTFVGEQPRVSTSTSCNLTSSDAKALEAANTTSSATMTSSMSCSMQ